VSQQDARPAPRFDDTGYDAAAVAYDLEYPDCGGDELDFWSRLAAEAGRELLELGAGTGRVTIALARLGYYVTGLDTAPRMLAKAERKRAAQPPDVAARLQFVRGDMRDFGDGDELDMVFVAFNSYLLLPDAAARARCLRSALRRLRPGGTFAVDVFAANEIDRSPDHEQVELLEADPETGRRITRERFYQHEPKSDRGQSTLIYRMHDRDGTVEESRMGYSLALVGRDEIVHGFETEGFEVTSVYGTHRHDAWGPESPNLLVVGRTPAR
jgi:SAM-dependent methyltransferase